MPLDLQHKIIMDLLPADIRDEVVVESTVVPPEDPDRKVQRVYLNESFLLLPDDNIPSTPQSLLDAAVYHLSKQSGSIASESLWFCGSLSLKNFCIANGFDPKSHNSKNRVVGYLKKSLNLIGSPFESAWNALQDCHRNAYKDVLLLDEVYGYLKSAEFFCNTVFEIHDKKQFNAEKFKKSLPKSMINVDKILRF